MTIDTVQLGHNHERRVVFVGPFGVGKTTALRAISDIAVVDTDVFTAERHKANPEKARTTVGFDYGEIKLDEKQRIALFGLPGQYRFDAMWQTFLPSAVAVVLWVYGDAPQAERDLGIWLEVLRRYIAPEVLSVAVTRMTEPVEEEQLEGFYNVLAQFNPLAPLICADPRRPEDVRSAVAMALSAISVPDLEISA
ncbi:MAG: hypothetical protein COX57_07265 [Alphaproteobacteria bacterium CG_4_10_14_0_2_um_filter_63_37]|nr:MAG: hypothetical protein AUJ55_02070 [Proteobacteria bacterium CG1_02_64_396]PJA24674.1 MAG: hypothetical protein COX57_07265 [Alphaproteobacteria bacterium CG_4_10_14_0_2_um_filter_63_37]